MLFGHRFWDLLANTYAKKPVEHVTSYQKKLEVTQGYLRPEMKVMEFGCGTGSTALAHSPHVAHILAIDFSGKMLEIARAKATTADVQNVTFERTGIDDFEQGRRFDVVMGHSVLHLLDNRNAVISRVFEMLEPGGVFVTSTVCVQPNAVVRAVVWVGRTIGLLPALNFVSPDELRADMQRVGFDIDYDWQPGPDRALFMVAIRPV